MAFTYGDSPNTSTRDAVRFLLGDTVAANELLSDAEITFLLAEEPNVYFAAATGALKIRADKSALADKAVGDLRISYRNQAAEFKALAADLKARGAIRAANPYAGGISISDKDAVEDDNDRTVPTFKKGQFDNPDAQDPESNNSIWNAS